MATYTLGRLCSVTISGFECVIAPVVIGGGTDIDPTTTVASTLTSRHHLLGRVIVLHRGESAFLAEAIPYVKSLLEQPQGQKALRYCILQHITHGYPDDEGLLLLPMEIVTWKHSFALSVVYGNRAGLQRYFNKLLEM